MEIKSNIFKNIKQLILCCVALLYTFSNMIAQPTTNSTKSYYINDGKMNIKLSKKLTDKNIDEFIKQYGLEDLMLTHFIRKNFVDSILKKGWKIEQNNANQCIISKPLFAAEDIENPFDIARLAESIFTPINQAPINSSVYGVNTFKTKSDFEATDSSVAFFLNNYNNAKQVKLAGSFTNWQANSLAMKKVNNGWVLNVKLTEGKHLYKFIVDGNWILDEDNKQKENDGKGNTNSVYYKTNTHFILNGYTNARKVIVSGSFNNWHPSNLKMFKTKTGWSLPLYLANGTHTYRFVVDGNWMKDPNNKDVFANEFGEFNSVKRIGTSRLFKIDGFQNAKKVFLLGSFNGWRDYELQMQKTANGWQIPYTLAKGNYEYKFKIDGKLFDANGRFLKDNEQGSFIITDANYIFRLRGYNNAKTIFLAGDFNGWSEKGFAMKREGNEWVIKLYLTKGKHLYKFIVDGNWILDPANKLWEQNEFNTKNSIIWVEN